jgi:hypothetical protein
MTSFTSNRPVRQKGSRAKRRPQTSRLHVEELEHRTVPSYFPPTTDGIHVFEDQLPTGLSSAMTQFVATHIDGTQKELLNQTQQFRAINPNFTVLHYQLGTGNSPFDYILNNQWSSDWTYVNQQESWFAHQSYSGEPQSAADLASGRVGNSTPWYQADIANSAWQQYTLNQVLQNIAATGSNAWFADSFTYGIGGGGYDGTIPTRYQGTNAANPVAWPGGVTWTDQLGNWAQTIETAFANYNAANGTSYQFIPNLDARVTSWEPNWYDNAGGVPFIGGAFLEGFGQYTDTYNWTLSMNPGLNLTDNGKIVIMQPYPSADPSTAAGQQQVNFFLGTYLLLKGNETYLNIDYGGGVQYYPQYELNLGAAVTPLQSNVSGYLWNGVYRRNFQNGFVLVNPGSTTYTLNLGGNYQLVQGTGGGTMTDADLDANGNYIGASLTYQTVNSITLTGGSAAIFLNNLPAGTSTFSGTVFQDYNHNGRLDSGEPGLAGQTLFIDLRGTGVLAAGDPTATTNALGNFQFTVAAPGTYTIRPVLYGGTLLDTPAGGSYQVAATSGATISGLNFGEVLTNIAVPLKLPLTTPFPAQGNANADYVEALYRFILQRNADPAGLAYWTGLLNRGTSRASVAGAIWKSAEHFTQEVTAFYQTILGRQPDAAGLAAWVTQLETGTPEERIVVGFLNSPEFLSRGDKYFVDQMYSAILGRPADLAGEKYWLAQLGDDSSGNPTGQPPALSHAQVIRHILYSTESLTRLIDGNYQVFLGRIADPQGFNAWLSALQQGTPFATIAEGFLSSNEFYNAAAANR